MKECIFCNFKELSKGEYLYDYEFWRLILQSAEKRQKTKQAAGMLVSKRHMVEVVDADSEEFIELSKIIKDAAKKLCVATGTTYLEQETIGFNQGINAGQTVMHAHVHILPSAQEDPETMKIRGGIGGAFEALRKERLKD